MSRSKQLINVLSAAAAWQVNDLAGLHTVPGNHTVTQVSHNACGTCCMLAVGSVLQAVLCH